MKYEYSQEQRDKYATMLEYINNYVGNLPLRYQGFCKSNADDYVSNLYMVDEALSAFDYPEGRNIEVSGFFVKRKEMKRKAFLNFFDIMNTLYKSIDEILSFIAKCKNNEIMRDRIISFFVVVPSPDEIFISSELDDKVTDFYRNHLEEWRDGLMEFDSPTDYYSFCIDGLRERFDLKRNHVKNENYDLFNVNPKLYTREMTEAVYNYDFRPLRLLEDVKNTEAMNNGLRIPCYMDSYLTSAGYIIAYMLYIIHLLNLDEKYFIKPKEPKPPRKSLKEIEEEKKRIEQEKFNELFS